MMVHDVVHWSKRCILFSVSFDCEGCFHARLVNFHYAFLLSEYFYQGSKVYYALPVGDKTLGWPEAVRKGNVYAYGTFTNGGRNFKC